MTIEEREVVALVVSAVAVLAALGLSQRVVRVPGRGTFLAAGGLWLLGWFATVVESALPTPLDAVTNLVEHGAFAGFSVVLLVWVLRHWGDGRSR